MLLPSTTPVPVAITAAALAGLARLLRHWRRMLPLWAKPAMACERWTCQGDYIVDCFTLSQYRALNPDAPRSAYRGFQRSYGSSW